MRECTRCGAPVQPSQGPGRPRKVCEACRPTRSTAKVVQINVEPSKDVDGPAQDRREPPLVARVRAQLTEAGRQDTVEGLVALELAARILDAATTGSAVAALSRELTATLARALEGISAPADPVADIAARRARRASGQ